MRYRLPNPFMKKSSSVYPPTDCLRGDRVSHRQAPPPRGASRIGNLRATLAGGASALSLLLLASPARAAVPDVSKIEITGLDDVLAENISDNNSEVTINIKDCVEIASDTSFDVTVTWTFATKWAGGYAIKRKQESETCSSAALTDDTDTCDRLASDSTFDAKDLGVEFAFSSLVPVLDADACINTPDSVTTSLILVYEGKVTGETSDTIKQETITFVVDSTRPAAPDSLEAVPGETSATVSWDEVTDSDDYVVYYSTSKAAIEASEFPEELDDSLVDSTASADTSVTIDGLTGTSTYYFRVVSRNSVLNASRLSDETIEVTTAPTVDFFEDYVASGGQEEGGYCAVSRGGGNPWPFVMFMMIPFARFRSRRR